MIVGHGLVERQLLGPATATGAPEQGSVVLRRYRCRACRAVLLVGPRGLVRRRWYGAGAMAVAFSVVAGGGSGATARDRTSPQRTVGVASADRWITLDRWLAAARRGELFGIDGLDGLARRTVAEHVVLVLAARGGRELGADLVERAFAGAAMAA
ncbi:MAG: hypothetical protein U0359_00685 [Byssovorax sp.]